MTQKQRILEALKAGPVCGTTFLGWYMPRYSARILELRSEGYEITTRRCQMHDHENPQTIFELAEIDQLSLL
jgi:hypothetical protein